MDAAIRIIGIDPGLRHTGWGVIDVIGSKLAHVAHGTISPDPKMDLSERLGAIFRGIDALVSEYSPDSAGVEETLVNANPRQALLLGQARGAAMTALSLGKIGVQEFAPRRIKSAVVGSGAADKAQVGFMVQTLLPRAGKMTSDAADALACAICAAHYFDHNELSKGVA